MEDTHSTPKKAVSFKLSRSIRMEDHEGKFMGFSFAGRAEWYMERNLAFWVEQGKVFRLNFKPRGNGKAHIPYYHQPVEHRCVCCGTVENMTRHHVFPYMFKSLLPIHYKARSNYDILPVCSDCHETYEREADLLKADIKREVCSRSPIQFDKNEIKYYKGIMASRRFLKQYTENPDFYKNVPQERVECHRKIANQAVDTDMLEAYEDHHKSWIVRLMQELADDEEKLFQFVKMWRKHFLDTMKPQHMPALWVVDMPIEVTNEYRQEMEEKAQQSQKRA